jgi:hypothetical protein
MTMVEQTSRPAATLGSRLLETLATPDSSSALKRIAKRGRARSDSRSGARNIAGSSRIRIAVSPLSPQMYVLNRFSVSLIKGVIFQPYRQYLSVKPFVLSLSKHEWLNRPPFDRLRANG